MTECTKDTPTSLPEAGEHWRALLVDDADCCELLARLKEEYDLQHAEIERLRARIVEFETERMTLLKSLSCRADLLWEMGLQRTQLEKRVLKLEAELAITHGSLTRPEPDEPATYVHDVPPNAPR